MDRGSDSRPHPYWLAAGTGLVGVSLGAVAVLMGMRSGARERQDAPVATAAGSAADSAAGSAAGSAAAPDVVPEVDTRGRTPSLVEAVAGTRDAVVNLGTERTLGAGVIVDPRGIVVTNYHVISDALAAPRTFGPDAASTPQVTARFEDGRELVATILVADRIEDLAILRLVSERADERFEAATLGDSSSLAVGQEVFAIGNPFGLNHSVSRGIVSALDRTDLLRSRKLPFIQLDASINLGNSGGPLFAWDGSLVGIVTSRREDAEGIAFAVPVDHVRGFLRAVSDPGAPRRSGSIGLEVLPRTSGPEEPDSGYAAWLEVTRVTAHSPAQRADLRAGDRVVEVRGKRLDGLAPDERLDDYLVSTVRSMFAGERLPLTVVRDGALERVEVEVAAASSDRQLRIDAEDLLGLRLGAGPGAPAIDRVLPKTPFSGLNMDLEGIEIVRLLDRAIVTTDDLGAELATLREVVRARHGPVRVRVGLRDPRSGRSRDFLILVE